MKPPLEHIAWKGAAEAGVTLPDELTEQYARVERLEAEQAETIAEAGKTVDAVAALLGGKSLSQSIDAATASADVEAELTERRRVAAVAVRHARDAVSAWIARNRDLLIAEHLRPVVADVLAEAGEAAAKLETFAPNYDPAAIAAQATPSQLTAWRRSRELEDRFGALLGAWLSTWRSATANVGQAPGALRVPGHLRIDAPGGVHAWERPLEVGDVDVRDGRNLDALAVAAWAEPGGYRLATGQEVLDVTQRDQTTYPWIAGERQPRQVLIPTGEPVAVAEPSTRRPGRSGRASFA